MPTIVKRIYRESRPGVAVQLPKYGTALENRYVFDSAARELKAMAEQGLVKIVDEQRSTQEDAGLITDVTFMRMI